MTRGSTPRPYRKVRRARQEAETRERITEAAVELHRTLGPARTSIAEVARLAGVSRMTVYSHFPTGVDLFRACSTHWAARNPFPDPEGWLEIDDPPRRLIAALGELYRWYRLKEDMLGKIFRDLPIVPALQEVMEELWSSYVDAVVDTLASGWDARAPEPEDLTAALRLAVDFNTWRIVTAAGLDDDRAAELVARMIAGA